MYVIFRGISRVIGVKNTRRIDTFFVHVTLLPRNNTDVTHCEKTVFYFQNKAVYQAEDRRTDMCLKRLLPYKGKHLKFIILFFSDVT